MIRIVFLISLFIPLPGLTQEKKSYQLQKVEQPFYSETNYLDVDSTWRFQNKIVYNEPNSSDEELYTRLVIQIRDTTALLRKKKIDLKDDSIIVKCSFSQWGVWHGTRYDDSTSVTGQVQLRSLTSIGVTLHLNLAVTHRTTGVQYIYDGERMFSKFHRGPSLITLMNSLPLKDLKKLELILFYHVASHLATIIRYY